MKPVRPLTATPTHDSSGNRRPITNMRNPSQDERAALALVTASIIGDKRAAKRHECSDRTLRAWRQRLEEGDEALAAACLRARAEMTDEWRKEVPVALLSAVSFISEAGAEGDPKNPEMVEAMGRCVERLSNSLMTMRMLDARLDRADVRSPNPPGPTGPHVVPLRPGRTGTDGG